MTHITYETWKIDKLKNHPLNQQVFGEMEKAGADAEFVDSVRKHGILQPLIVLDNGLILAGHRRRIAASRAGLKEVPVIVRRDIPLGPEADLAWFETNRNREMTTEQRARWYEKRAAIEAELAKKRQQANLLIGPNPPAKQGPETTSSDEKCQKSRVFPVTGNFPQRENSGKRAPTAKDLAAEDAGMDRKTADKAVEVVHCIEELEAAGQHEVAEELRETLNNKSVSAAHRLAKQLLNGKPEKPQESPAIVKDALGHDVPQALRPAHDTAAHLEALGRKLDPLRRNLEELAQKPGGQFIDMTDANRLFRELKGLITQARYWSFCPRCDGSGCSRCSQTGFIPYSKRGQLSTEDKAKLGVE